MKGLAIKLLIPSTLLFLTLGCAQKLECRIDPKSQENILSLNGSTVEELKNTFDCRDYLEITSGLFGVKEVKFGSNIYDCPLIPTMKTRNGKMCYFGSKTIKYANHLQNL